MTKNSSGNTDQASQTYSVDWSNVHSKCPCCHHQMKVDFKWGPDSVNLTLVPIAKVATDHNEVASINSSLINIVSVESVDDRQLSSKNFPIPSFSYNNLRSEEDSSEINESSSSSVSNNSGSRNLHFEPVVQITTTPDFAPSKQRPLYSFIMPKTEPGLSQNISQCSNQEIRLKCQFHGCGLILDGHQQLELHYKEHKGEKVQRCDWENCNRLFGSKEKLRNHVRCKHTGERPYKCDQCGKAFTSTKHLKDHGVLHTDMRPFSCEWDGCGIGFRRKHHLTAHQRVHTKERPFACHFPGCDMKFTKTHHVKRHYETHFKNTAYKMYQAELSGVQMQVTTGTQQPSSVSPPVPLPNTSSISSFTFL